MNRIILPFLAAVGLMVTGCLKDEPGDKVKDIKMSVSSETGIMYGFMAYPVECMQVMSEDNPGVWEPLAFEAIEGFTYERGHEYYLEVRKTILSNPPQDGDGITYSLLRILQDRQVTEIEKPEEKEIHAEEDIEYHDLCPINKYAIAPVFKIDENRRIYYRWTQTQGISYDLCRIYFENIMDKADPDFITFNRVPYMAIYSYVISPLTEEIHYVRNERGGPMFKEVIPENEFDYICDEMQSGEELHYALILVNVYLKGLQKLEFSIQKQ